MENTTEMSRNFWLYLFKRGLFVINYSLTRLWTVLLD